MSVLSAGFELNNRRRRFRSSTLGSLSGSPTMLLNFLNSSSLDPRVTFSRGTNATMIDSTGQITYAPSNLLVNSNSFKASNWVTFGTVTTVSNAVVAPDRTTTADVITVAASSGIYQNRTAVAGVNYSVSVWLKADSPVTIRLASNTDTSVLASTSCLVTTGWQRFSLTRVCPVGATTVNLQLDQTTGVTVHVWGAQLEAITYETSPRTYNSTTPKNLLGFTEEFDNAAWVKTLATVTANSIADPNGNLNADTLSATAGGGTVLQTLTLLAIPYTFSIWLKRKTGTGDVSITVDGTTYSTKIITTDWVRYSTVLTPAAGSKTIGVQIVTSGDEVYAWGAQVSDSASLDPYAYNPVAAPTATAYYGPRFDYNPVTLKQLGLLIEEARTNLLIDSGVLSSQSVTTVAGVYTLSFYGTGSITLSGTNTGVVTGTGVFPSRVRQAITTTAGTLTLTVSGSVTGAQLELGGFATSYIPSYSAAATRAADIATMVGSNFTNWYNQSSGSFLVETEASPNSFAGYITATNGSITQNSVHIDNDTGNMRAVYISGSVNVATLSLGAIGTVGATNIIATAYSAGNFAASRNGGTAVTVATGAVPAGVVQLSIGGDNRGDPLNYADCHIKDISYYNTRLSNAQLEEMTK